SPSLALPPLFCSITRPHPRSTLFPYTTLFRSASPATLNVPALLTVAPCPLHKSAPLKLTVPLLLSVRCASDLLPVPLNTRLPPLDRKSTRLNSSLLGISYAVLCSINTPLPASA